MNTFEIATFLTLFAVLSLAVIVLFDEDNDPRP